ncbi:MAG TPA: hypothetical protein VGJ00_00105 [Rhabdochlamydiaceae bacterium]|jgi:hypothetical protein
MSLIFSITSEKATYPVLFSNIPSTPESTSEIAKKVFHIAETILQSTFTRKLSTFLKLPLPVFHIISGYHLPSERSDQYQLLLEENELDEERDFVMLGRRVCWFLDHNAIDIRENIDKAMINHFNLDFFDSFIKDSQIFFVEPLQFLRKSPFIYAVNFQKPMEDDDAWLLPFENLIFISLFAIGKTQKGNHVILTQNNNSIFYCTVAMLLLDYGKQPKTHLIRREYKDKVAQAQKWIREEGLESHITAFSDENRITDTLCECLKEGPGLLTLSKWDDHPIILDEVSLNSNKASLRDSLHGWAITIPFDFLLSLIDKGSYFLQIKPESKCEIDT